MPASADSRGGAKWRGPDRAKTRFPQLTSDSSVLRLLHLNPAAGRDDRPLDHARRRRRRVRGRDRLHDARRRVRGRDGLHGAERLRHALYDRGLDDADDRLRHAVHDAADDHWRRRGVVDLALDDARLRHMVDLALDDARLRHGHRHGPWLQTTATAGSQRPLAFLVIVDDPQRATDAPADTDARTNQGEDDRNLC